jgi:exodeoxyribonuclease VII large subunit
MTDALSVSQLNAKIEALLKGDPDLDNVWVEGEISNWMQASSGHCYFALKANDSSDQMVKGVMWRAAADVQARMAGLPKNGDSVQVRGSVRIYASRSEYQLNVTAINPVGIGALYAKFERLRAALTEEGLFDSARKRPLPTAPQRIGIVTSPEAAVFQDVQNVLRRRYPLATLVLAPTLVQGNDAPPQIVRALGRLNAREDIDVILICRGGGSLEDLWCFNDERVVRAVAASRIVIVSGVGHETDTTLTDYAADLRASTPTAAAELVTPDIAALYETLDSAQRRLHQGIGYHLDTLKMRLNDEGRMLARLSPSARIDSLRQRIDDWNARMRTQIDSQIALRRAQCETRHEALEAANPAAILARGYAIVRRADDGTPITRAAGIRAGATLAVQFHDGQIAAYVYSETKARPAHPEPAARDANLPLESAVLDKDDHAGNQRPLF